MGRLFISHSSRDNDVATDMRAWLAENGWDDVFLDTDPDRGIRAGTRWQDELRRAATRCEVVMILVSPDWLASSWCQAEYLLATQMSKRILAVIVRPVDLADLPGTLSAEWQAVDLTTQPLDAAMGAHNVSADGLERLKGGLRDAGVLPEHFAWPPPGDDAPTPYPGLAAIAEPGIFFGRDGQIVLGLDQVRGLREAEGRGLFVILGASGAGKSSFLKAGLLPRLRREPGLRVLPVVRPGRRALSGDEGLAASIAAALTENNRPVRMGDVVAGVKQDVAALMAEVVAAGGNPDVTLVLPIDQAEEFLEGDEGPETLEIVRQMASDTSLRVLVLMTIRSDRWSEMQAHPAFAEARPVLFSLPPMPQGAYGEVIRAPARRMTEAGWPLEIEPVLVDRLLEEIAEGGARDSLPLLSLTLQSLWREEGGTGVLRLATYEATGGLQGCIEAAVERAFERADADRRIPLDRGARLTLLRRGFIPWLAGIDPETGTPKRRVARLSEIPEEARPLMEILVEERLLRRDEDRETGETVIEPTHEALLRQWALMDSWLAEDLEDLTAIEAVRRAARDWAANLRGSAWVVHKGGRLDVAAAAAARPEFAAMLEQTDRAYLGAAVAEQKAEAARIRRRRRAWSLTAVTAVVALTAFSVVLWSALKRTEAAQARTASSLAIVTARDLRTAGRGEEAIGAALEAWRLDNTLASRTALAEALLAVPDRLIEAYALSAPAQRLAVLDDGRVALADSSGVVRFLQDGRLSEPVDLAPEAPPWDGSATRLVRLKSDGDVVVAAFGDGAVRKLETDTVSDVAPGRRMTLSQSSGVLALSRDARALAAFTNNGGQGEVLLRHCNGTACEDNVLAAGVFDGSLAIGGARLALFTETDGMRVLDLPSGPPLALDVGVSVGVLALSEDGQRLAVSTRVEGGRSVAIYDLDESSGPLSLHPIENRVASAAFSPDGARLAYVCERLVVCIATVGHPEPLRLTGHLGGVASFGWSADSARLVTMDLNRTIRVFDATGTALAGVEALRASGNGILARTSQFLVSLSPTGEPISRRPLAEAGQTVVPIPTAAEEREVSTLLDGRSVIYAETGAPVPATLLTSFTSLAAAGPDRLLALPFRDRHVATLDLSRDPVVLRLSDPLPERPTGAVVDVECGLAYVATTDGALRRVGLDDGREKETVLSPGAQEGIRIGATSLALSPDGSLLVASLGIRELWLFETTDGSVRHRVPLGYEDTKVVAFSSDGARLAVLGSNGLLEVWQLAENGPEQIVVVGLEEDGRRPADIEWLGNETLAIALPDGIRKLSLDPQTWAARATGLFRVVEE